ncbi:class I SAM-dependent methyltransferase [Tepidamorphus sp. 3E244]|uniref:class I SAM-dependent methyltransferase n=1 Tax=Tepidamorphus sp. 3E244 TaxID=3385498 RepID=UPI0038FCECB7
MTAGGQTGDTPPSLQDLGRHFGTDKHDASHSFLGESYLDIYDRYMTPYRELPVNLLELGVRGGHSLRMWKDYFRQGRIIGVDIKPECVAQSEDRIEVEIASQNDADALKALSDRVGGFDIILDDASHINALSVASFRILFPLLSPGGLYIIEDLGMSWVDYANHEDDPDFMENTLADNAAIGNSIRQDRADLETVFREKLFDMDMRRGDVRLMHFWSQLVVIQKASEQP